MENEKFNLKGGFYFNKRRKTFISDVNTKRNNVKI